MPMFRKVIATAVCASLPALAVAQVPEALRDAARSAVVANPEVQAGWHAFRASEEEQDVARGGYLPQLDLTASTGRERRTRPGLGTDSYSHRNATLSLNQMVYDGFFTRSEVARLGHAKLARYFELVDASENAALEALRAYADVLRYRELVRLAQENYVQHRQIHQQIAERTGAGVGRRVDLEQATGRLALAESNLLTEVSNLHDVSARYQRIVGSTPPEELPAAGPRLGSGPLPAGVAGALREAFAASPALAAAQQNVQSGQAQVDARRAAYHPRLDLRASQAVDRNLENVSGTSRDGVVALVLTYNLFRGGSDAARIRQAGEALNQAKDLREKACRDLRQTLSIAYNDVQRLEEQLRYLDQHQLSIEKAREAYRRQFDIGQRTLLDLLDTENEYFQARRAYVAAATDQFVAQARTLAGMGHLLRALNVAREDLPAPADLGYEGNPDDPASICPPEGPSPLQIDKEVVFAEAMRAAGYAAPQPGNGTGEALPAGSIQGR
ncbi:TolC family outer membrane protein [Pseudothauera rhizosphaerae]|uniref:Channel protein TolC n=1 Tax=Pseudothauera rhizosphaerae TaxID=2565932 RepID=A0A4S4A8D1_9RHOO|nr:TolC family outer membrane protein [Pseudothauera rhizosphaerae]THF54996.1 channel protein TolC [Pseudothauera rhizosphaerae]